MTLAQPPAAARAGSRMGARGFLLLPVTLALALLGALALLLAHEAGLVASRAGGEAEAAEARYVAEAGLAHAVWTANRSACSAYALPATPFEGGTYSAAFTPAAGSPITVAATGTLASGVSRTVTRAGVRVYDGQATATLQPDAASGKDAYVNEQQRNRNYGASAAIAVDSGGAHDYYALLAFDLSSIPATARIESAVLSLNLESFGSTNLNARFTAYGVTEPWTEGTGDGTASGDGATYDTSDGATPWTWPASYDAANPLAVTPVNPTFAGWHDWDLTAAVSAWTAGTAPNHGVVLIGNNQVRDAFFTSSDGADPALRPKLVVTYSCECGGPANVLVAQPDAAAGKDAYLDQWFPSRNYGADNELWVQAAGSIYRALLAFDLSTIPAAATVTSATLDLYQKSPTANGGPVEVHAATTPWSEGNLAGGNGATSWAEASPGVPWTSTGGDYEAAAAATAVLPFKGVGTFQWDITALAGEWVSGTRANEGLILVPGDGSASAYFASSDDTTAARRPRLTVEYTCPCGVPCGPPPPPPSATLLPDADNTLYESSPGANHGTDADLVVGTGNTGSAPSHHAVLHFDLSAVPAGATVTSARLRLEATSRRGGAAFEVEVHRGDQAWTEGGSSWNDADAAVPWTAGPGGTYSATVVATVPAAGAGRYEWEIAPLVQEWLDAVSPNQGLVLVHTPVAKGNRLHFSSREGATPPELVVEYTPP